MVSIAGGEPLIHPEIDEIVRALLARKKFVYLCTNAPAAAPASSLSSRRRRTSPGPCTSTACASATTPRSASEGVFDECVARDPRGEEPRLPRHHQHDVLLARPPEHGASGARLPERRARRRRDDDLAGLRLREGARPGALPRGRADAQALRRGLRRRHGARRWRLNHSPLFLDFLEGKADFDCTAWAIPSYSTLGWQKPCYLMSDGYAQSYRELLETTRLGEVRARARSALRELHGPLRLRADRRARDDAFAARIAAGIRRIHVGFAVQLP